MQSYNKIPQPLSVLGISVTPFKSFNHTVECISHRIATREKTFCVAINPEKLSRVIHEPELAATLNEADMQICDGIGTVYAVKLLLGQSIERCTGIQLFFKLIRKAAEKQWKVFLLGASPESNQLAYSNLLESYPGLQIVGCRDGYFKDYKTVIKEINESHADLLFVAMGSPKQEFWIAEHKDAITVPFCMGIGGTLDVVSGKAKRAPRIFRKTGTEFLYRLLTNPSWATNTRFRRALSILIFILLVMKMKLFGAKQGM